MARINIHKKSKSDGDKLARPMGRSKSPGQLRLEALILAAPKFNSAGMPVAITDEAGVLAADEDGVHFKPTRGRTLYSVAWADVARMFKLETLAANPDSAVFKTDLLSKGK